MSDLINCIECGGSLSSRASYCPHCHTYSFRGFICKLCGEVGKNSIKKEGIETEWFCIDGIDELSETVHSYHPECYDRVLQVNYSCPTCHHTVRQFQTHCFRCGEPFPTDNCGHCKLSLLTPTAVAHGGKLFHEFCASLKKTAWERERAELQRRAEEEKKRKADKERESQFQMERSRKEYDAIIQQQQARETREKVLYFCNLIVAVVIFIGLYASSN
jgi:hypothetical protein